MALHTVHFGDANFEHRFMDWPGVRGLIPRWMPYGMPRLSPQILQSVFYLYRKDDKGNFIGPCGSGVFIEKNKNAYMQFPSYYAVTARHVVTSGASIIRINAGFRFENGKIIDSKTPHHFIDREITDWNWAENGDDIACIDVTDAIDELGDPRNGLPISAVHEDDLVKPSFINRVALGPGDDAFMLGLFHKQHGGDRNTPAARFGNISLLADEKNQIEQGHGKLRPSHIFDMHSRPGFSGSPVFVYRTPANALTGIKSNGEWTLDTKNNVFLKLLGIHSGQFPDVVTARKAEAYGSPQPILDGEDLEIPSSMTVVCPAWEILILTESHEMKKARDLRTARKQQEFKGKRTRPEGIQAEQDGANPNHREDFMSLLSVAAKAKPQADQT